MLLIADAVLPISSPPLTPGAVAVRGRRIAGVGDPADLIRRFPDLRVRRLPGSALLPGLVNAHTHLELTPLRGRIPPGLDFVSWIMALVRERRRLSEGEIREGIRQGARESLGAGTTCLGDITGRTATAALVARAGLRARVFLEILGRDVSDPEAWVQGLLQDLRRMRIRGQDLVVPGISPHSPYTLSAQRLRLIARLLRRLPFPYAVHVAESREEMEYFLRGSGALRERLFPAAGWTPGPPPPSSSPLRYLEDLGLVTERLLLIHGVHLTTDDIHRLRRAGAHAVLCPRSNSFLGVGTPPARALLDEGIPTALGTDSLASSPGLSLWEEMRALRTLRGKGQDVPARTLLSMATLGGARALGLESEIGSLEKGKEADLIAVSLRPADLEDLETGLVDRTRESDIRLVLIAGRVLLDRAGDAPGRFEQGH